jgi:hypothetical protein
MVNPLLQKKGSVSVGPEQLDTLYSLLSGKNRSDKLSYLEARKGVASIISHLTTSLPPKSRLAREVRFAKWDVDTARSFSSSGDWDAAANSLLHAVWKLQSVAGLLQKRKKAYGYDISGEIGEVWHGSEDMANRENQKNIDDTAQPFEQHETKPNPANLTRDFLAEKDYPSLREKKNKRVHWPPRLR